MKTGTLMAAATFAVLVACGSVPSVLPLDTHPAIAASQPVIELLGFPECPNTPVMRDQLAAALSQLAPGWTFAETNQEQLPAGDLRRGYPTPTVLVNGRDLFGLPVPHATSLACRIYPGGMPDAAALAERLRAVTR